MALVTPVCVFKLCCYLPPCAGGWLRCLVVTAPLYHYFVFTLKTVHYSLAITNPNRLNFLILLVSARDFDSKIALKVIVGHIFETSIKFCLYVRWPNVIFWTQLNKFGGKIYILKTDFILQTCVRYGVFRMK